MNDRTVCLKYKQIFILAGILVFAGESFAQDASPVERKQAQVEIKGNEQIGELKPVAEIREEDKELPEIPKPITREDLGPAEQAQLDELEMKRSRGKITETEYQLEKDSLFRGANIKF